MGGVHALALIGHTQCGMVDLVARKEQFVAGLVENAGWTREAAEEHFHNYAPMLYRVEDNRLYFIREDAA